jgi:hypothetical protein
MAVVDMGLFNLDIENYIPKEKTEFNFLVGSFITNNPVEDFKYDRFISRCIIVYKNDTPNDEFETDESLVEFLKSKQAAD